MNESISSIDSRYREFTEQVVPIEQRLVDAEVLTNAGYKLIRSFAAAAIVGYGSDRLVSREVDVWMSKQQIDQGSVIGPMVIASNSGEPFSPPRSRAEWQPTIES